jgi:hypothetical protein
MMKVGWWIDLTSFTSSPSRSTLAQKIQFSSHAISGSKYLDSSEQKYILEDKLYFIILYFIQSDQEHFITALAYVGIYSTVHVQYLQY